MAPGRSTRDGLDLVLAAFALRVTTVRYTVAAGLLCIADGL
jgi:hypothetical protein